MGELIAGIQVLLVALMAWGAFLCLARQDRRSGRERRKHTRGGRRLADGARRVVQDSDSTLASSAQMRST